MDAVRYSDEEVLKDEEQKSNDQDARTPLWTQEMD